MNERSLAKTVSVAPVDEGAACNCAELSSANLLNALRSCLPVLPVLATQLQEVANQVEQAVVGVCGNFQDMAARARQAAARVPLAKSTAADGPRADAEGVNGLISSTRETMGSLLQRIEQTSEFSSLAVQRMRTIEERIGGLDEILHEIDEIAAQARVLALNGQLEAARLGAKGNAFAIVATETSKMANHAMTSSMTIRETTELVSAGIGGTSKELRERAAADSREAAMSRDEVDRVLDAMTVLHEETQRTIEEAKRESDQLARDISAAVMTMQFQDTVSQRIGHVIHTLEEMHGALESQMGSSGAASSFAPAQDWANRMAGRYTMASEHKVLAAHVSRSTGGGQDLENNIELF
ncbi:MAG: methyl-accepting chemotaxis protein [Thermoguttaceae bacterium]